jgi:hypothetical protein
MAPNRPKEYMTNERSNFYKVGKVFNDISAISWQSVLLVEETGENH